MSSSSSSSSTSQVVNPITVNLFGLNSIRNQENSFVHISKVQDKEISNFVWKVTKKVIQSADIVLLDGALQNFSICHGLPYIVESAYQRYAGFVSDLGYFISHRFFISYEYPECLHWDKDSHKDPAMILKLFYRNNIDETTNKAIRVGYILLVDNVDFTIEFWQKLLYTNGQGYIPCTTTILSVTLHVNQSNKTVELMKKLQEEKFSCLTSEEKNSVTRYIFLRGENPGIIATIGEPAFTKEAFPKFFPPKKSTTSNEKKF